jgi:predicted RND superfamily exporter protein
LAGLAGLAGLPLNLALLVALVVISGLAADDSLHLMVSYTSQKKGGYPKSAWKRALLQKSRAMYLSSLALGLGVLPLAWSSLQTSVQFCLFMWFGMALAWLADQWLLPLMLKSMGNSGKLSGRKSQ